MEPFRKIVGEILVCDTGSKDKTKEIAKSLGARVIEMKLDKDFSKVRNAMLEIAREPWLLTQDADFRIAHKDIPKLGPLILQKKADAYFFPVRSYSNLLQPLFKWIPCKGEYPREEKFSGAYGFYESKRILLFKNHPKIRYVFPVHESLRPALENNDFKIKTSSIVAHHFELHKGIKHHIKKHGFYTPLERQTAQNWPSYPQNHFNLAADLILTKKNPEEAARIAALLTRRWPDQALFWTLRAVAAMLRGNAKAAERFALKSVFCEKNSANLCLSGWIQIKKGNFKRAESFLKRSLRAEKYNPLALNLLGILKERTGRLKESIPFFTRAINILPVYSDALFNRAAAWDRLEKVSLAAGDYNKVVALTDCRQAAQRLKRLKTLNHLRQRINLARPKNST